MVEYSDYVEILRQLKKGGVTYKKLADMVGCTEMTMRRWVEGRGEPSPVYKSIIKKVMMEFKRGENEEGT